MFHAKKFDHPNNFNGYLGVVFKFLWPRARSWNSEMFQMASLSSENCGIWGQARSRFHRNKHSPNACDENMVGDKSLGPFQSWHRLSSSLHMKKSAFRLIINQEMNSRCYSHFLIIECGVGAVAEWSKTLQLREKINENEKIPGSSPGLGNLLNKCYRRRFDSVVSKTRRHYFVQSWLKSRRISRRWFDKPRLRFFRLTPTTEVKFFSPNSSTGRSTRTSTWRMTSRARYPVATRHPTRPYRPALRTLTGPLTPHLHA